jgi:hypothetical protein
MKNIYRAFRGSDVGCLDFLELGTTNQQLEILRLIAKGEESAVQFSGLGLNSIEETGAWTDVNSPGGAFNFSLIPDAWFVLEIVASKGKTIQSQMLEVMNSIRSLNLHSEHLMLSAFQLEGPPFPHGTEDVLLGAFASGVGKSQLGHSPAVESWNQGQGSRKKLLDRKLPGIRTSFQSLITNSLMHSNHRVCNLETKALERSISWMINLSSWMDRCYENSHVTSRMLKAKTWALVAQLMCQVFADIFVVRMGTIQ